MSESDKSVYNLSKDYERLYGMLCDGYIVVGFVDYEIYMDKTKAFARDVVKIVRHREYDIFVGVRGTCYGNIYPFHRKHGGEKERFLSLCESLNLEWVEPITASPAPVDMVLYCPECFVQHIDKPQPEKGWDNPPHRSHECQVCEHVWRPADVPTNGVEAIKTKGQRDGFTRTSKR